MNSLQENIDAGWLNKVLKENEKRFTEMAPWTLSPEQQKEQTRLIKESGICPRCQKPL